MFFFGMDSTFRINDLGSGVGKPNWHFAQYGVDASVGVELVFERYKSSLVAQRAILLKEKEVEKKVSFVHANILELTTFNDFDIIYQFDCGFPDDVFQYILSIFGGRARFLVSFRDKAFLKQYGFQVVLLAQLPDMTAYFYSVGAIGALKVTDPLLSSAIDSCYARESERLSFVQV